MKTLNVVILKDLPPPPRPEVSVFCFVKVAAAFKQFQRQ
jgi:hypothetical protein